MQHWLVDTTLVDDWIDSLGEDDYDHLVAAIGLLSANGPALGRPLVDTIKGSTIPNMKELRPPSRGRATMRVLFVFDPMRTAVMLIGVGGDKTGNWTRWYEKNIPIAERRYWDHLDRVRNRRRT